MYDHLLQQARRLARLDPKKPRQANLRRAVSSAYYALFHLHLCPFYKTPRRSAEWFKALCGDADGTAEVAQ